MLRMAIRRHSKRGIYWAEQGDTTQFFTGALWRFDRQESALKGQHMSDLPLDRDETPSPH